jgi:hypothetical protein
VMREAAGVGLDCPHWGLDRDLGATSRSFFPFSSPQRRTGQETEAWSSGAGTPHPESVGGDRYADVARGPRSSAPSPTSHCSAARPWGGGRRKEGAAMAIGMGPTMGRRKKEGG